MSHLLAISVGPVQEFIAAARRTRDLWFGSCLLSEISKAVAKSVCDNGGNLIFPHPDADLNADPNLSVANVILAEIKSGNPREIAASAKQAARDRWTKFTDEAKKEAAGVIQEDIWNDQVDDVIEFYSAWVERSEDYKADRAGVMRLLAGRKNCRDFLPALGRAGVPKSSLDGQRESVLKRPSEWPVRFSTRLRVREGEQLDVVGLVKRVAGGTQPYPSVSRIAADPWVRGNKDKPAFDSVVTACEQLGPEVVHPLNSFSQFKDFAYEGTAVYPSRHHEWLEETELNDADLESLCNALKNLPDADPYLAVLVADGDKMGESISRLESPDDHRKFSKVLAGFASGAKEIVQRHNGVLVYAGGDDVLAFVPVDQCLKCSRCLHDRFAKLLEEYGQATLSVGIAIGHFMENLEVLLDYGRAAEKHAKQPQSEDGSQNARNALAVHLHKRGGAPIMVRDQWSTKPDERWGQFASMLSGGNIPAGLPYELRNMADIYESWPADTASEAIKQDVLRLIAKKQATSGAVREKMERYLVNLDASRLRHLAEELLVARQIGRAMRQANNDHPTIVETAS